MLQMKLSIQNRLPWPEVHGDLILIQITRVGGRFFEVKKKFYKRMAAESHERTAVRKEEVWINL
jgi:Tautomerase enzyme